MQIVITYASLRLTQSSGRAPQSQKDFYLQNLEHVKAIHQALHGWAGSPHYAPLVRTHTSKKKAWDYVEMEITFTTSLYDAAAAPAQHVQAMIPQLEGNVLE